MLHLAVVLWGVGLVYFFWHRDQPSSIIALVSLLLMVLIYVVSMTIPAIRLDCPYRTPLTHGVALILEGFRGGTKNTMSLDGMSLSDNSTEPVSAPPSIWRDSAFSFGDPPANGHGNPYYRQTRDVQGRGALFKREERRVQEERAYLDDRIWDRMKEFIFVDALGRS
jgi:hypothetical protein